MSLLETKHTLSRLNVLKRDLHRAVTIFSCFSMLAFTVYNIYLLIANLNSVFYLVIYSTLIVSIISLFLVEILIKEDKKLLKNEKRKAKEQKVKCKKVIKILKFVAKFLLVAVAVWETVTNFNVSLSNIANVCSAVLLVVQLVFELIVAYIVKQIDYFRLSVDMDFNASSAIVKKVIYMVNPLKKLEDDAIKNQKKSPYTEKELKMLEDIKLEAEQYVKEKKQKEQDIKKLAKPNKNKTSIWHRLKNIK